MAALEKTQLQGNATQYAVENSRNLPLNRLDADIAAYQVAIQTLPASKTDDARASIMRVVIARDHVARALADTVSPTVEELNRIAEQDQLLKANARHIDAILDEKTFANWRDTIQPPPNAWWWKLDELAAAADANAYPLLQFLASLFIVVTSVSLTIEIARRFLATGIQFIGVFTAVSTTLLTLLGGSAFTQIGRRGLEHFLGRLRIRRRHLPVAKISLALFLLLVIFAINRLLPAFAIYFNNQAQDAQDAKRYADAIDNYLLAINLSPNYPDPYYNLATAYEDVLDYAKAIDMYQRIEAVAPPGYYNLARSYNNLAHLYLVHSNDFAGALKLLNVAFNLKPTEPDILYALYKNRGWSLFKLALTGPAETDLRAALTLDNRRPAAHCLLAQLYEKNGDSANAVKEWGDCLAYATPERVVEVEPEWLATARYRLDQGGVK